MLLSNMNSNTNSLNVPVSAGGYHWIEVESFSFIDGDC